MKTSKKFAIAIISIILIWIIGAIILAQFNLDVNKFANILGFSMLFGMILMFIFFGAYLDEISEIKQKYCKKQGYEYSYEDLGYLVCGKIVNGKPVEKSMIKIDKLFNEEERNE